MAVDVGEPPGDQGRHDAGRDRPRLRARTRREDDREIPGGMRVARMERSEMRDSRITPPCGRLHPGYMLVLAFMLLAAPAPAAEVFKLAIGQRGLWDSAIAEIGTAAGIFARHGLELQSFYTSGGGETQQAVISGSSDIGVSAGTIGGLGAYSIGAPVRIIASAADGSAEAY